MIQELTGLNFYSDTQTLPTAEMREAMRDAVVGDDVSETDPTVKELEAEAARKLGKEAGLFVPSGHMGNLIAVLLHCKPGDEAIMEADAHVYYYEAGAAASIEGVMPRLVKGNHGVFGADVVRAALRPENIHFPRTRLLCVENTHNRGGGVIVPLGTLRELGELAREQGLAMHLDGARVFNAAVALGVDVAQIARPFDTVMFCLSKGLSAPVGSMLVGSAELMREARGLRKRLGGGMRQVGVLAAPGLVALRTMVDRLAEDHAHARALAEGFAKIDGYAVDLETVQTNMVMVDVSGLGLSSAEFAAKLAEHEVSASAMPPTRMRFVTHRHVGMEHVRRVLEIAERIASECAG